MLDNMLADSMAQLCAEYVTPEKVREVEKNADVTAIWEALNESGFCDALLNESHGGAGLCLSEAFPLVFACGQFSLPVPLAQTMVIKAFLGEQGTPIPEGPMTLATAVSTQDGAAVNCRDVQFGMVADWVLVEQANDVLLLPVAAGQRASTGVPGALTADLTWKTLPEETLFFDRTHDWTEIGACLLAGHIAGAADSVFRKTLNYAEERKQFGRSIGKFQAVQQQISVMAEQAAAARMAAQIGFSSSHWYPHGLTAAVAKSRCSEAVPVLASSAHAIHGAMGITAEYDLQLFTRRLHDWRRAFGSESYWNNRVGSSLLADRSQVVDFIRTRVDMHFLIELEKHT